MVRTTVLIRRSLGESTYPPNKQMTIAIAKIDIALMAVRGGYSLRRLGTVNAAASNAISIAPVPIWSRSLAAIGQPALDYAKQRNFRDDRTEDRD